MAKRFASVFVIAVFLLAPSAHAQDTVIKTFCMSAIGSQSTVDAVKKELLINVQRMAVNELFGELVVSSSKMRDFSLTDDMVDTYSSGYVRVSGNPVYENGSNFGEVCVTARLFVTDEDRKKLEPIVLKNKKCYANAELSTRDLKERTRELAIITALVQYEPKLKGIDKDALLPLVRKIKYLQSGFIQDTETYCVRFEGLLFPIEVMTLSKNRYIHIPPKALVEHLPDSAFSASSYWSNDLRGHGPPNSRFNSTSATSNWSAASNNGNQWLKVDLGREMLIREIATKGRYNGYSQWVTVYKISYSSDNVTWKYYTANGADVIFTGNNDNNTEVRHTLADPVQARYVRFHPTSWNSHITMRIEIFGVPVH